MADILDAINQAAELAATIGGRPTVFTAGPRLTAILGTARAMRRLGLPHQWAPNSAAWAVAARRDPLRYCGLFSD